MLKVALKALYSTLLTMPFNTGNKTPFHNVPYISGSICSSVYFVYISYSHSNTARCFQCSFSYVVTFVWLVWFIVSVAPIERARSKTNSNIIKSESNPNTRHVGKSCLCHAIITHIYMRPLVKLVTHSFVKL